MLSCSIWFSVPSFWMGGGLESRCVGRVYGTAPSRTVHTTTTYPKTRCRKPYAATQHLMLLMMGYVPETCRAKNTSIKIPSCIKLAFHFISLHIWISTLCHEHVIEIRIINRKTSQVFN